MNVIKPEHYLNADGQDLIDQWWSKYPVVVFIAIMDCLEERYRFRADRKNGEEDKRKADEVRKRKNEYIEAYLKEIDFPVTRLNLYQTKIITLCHNNPSS